MTLLLTVYFLLPTSYFLLPTNHQPLTVTESFLPSVVRMTQKDSQLSTVYFLLPTVY